MAKRTDPHVEAVRGDSFASHRCVTTCAEHPPACRQIPLRFRALLSMWRCHACRRPATHYLDAAHEWLSPIGPQLSAWTWLACPLHAREWCDAYGLSCPE